VAYSRVPSSILLEGMTVGVVVTGMGAASALGTGIEAHRAALWAGRSGIRAVDRFDTAPMQTSLGATWPGWDGREQPIPSQEIDLLASAAPFPLHDLALAAAREALDSSGVSSHRRRVALVFGTCFGHGFTEFSVVAERVAAALELGGPCVTISTACSSSTNAIGLGRDMLLRGHADVVVAGGADALLREAFAGFSALGVLSAEPCAPFSEPEGTTLGEGAGFLVLERSEDAARRGASMWASIEGYALSSDGHHETTPDPTGEGVARAIRCALGDAGFRATDVDFVSAHATGTANNDRIEWSAIQREIGAPLVSGSKGHLGHTQGAAGALELILALLCHREGRVPPTLHFRGAREGCPADPIAQNEPRAANVRCGLKLSAAFGGANAVLAYACGDVAPRPSRERAHVVVSGVGVVGPLGVHRLPDAHELEDTRSLGAARDVDLHAFGVDPRRLDRSARLLTAAAAIAFSNEKRDAARSGLFVAATRMPPQSSKRCTDSIRQRGVAGTSASAFARMSVNAPTGACSLALGLLGPTSTFSCGAGSGLLAWALAAEWLAWRDDATTILAASVDELAGSATDETEGAACVALSRATSVPPGSVVVASWSITGPGATLEAAEHAMTGRGPVDAMIVDGAPPAGLTHANIVDASRFWGTADATRSSVMAAVGAARIAAGRARSVLVLASGASSVAVVLERTANP
jgi:3-oxoacyl-[acyl-carrier-protein] synthase II